jgi:hypothetical protein
MSEKVLPLTDNCKKALSFLQANDKVWVGADLAEAAGIAGIHPVMNSLVKRGFAEKGTETRPFTDKKGKTVDKDYVTYELTDAGRDYQE